MPDGDPRSSPNELCEEDCSEAIEQGMGFVIEDVIPDLRGSRGSHVCLFDTAPMRALAARENVFDIAYDRCALG